MLHSIGAISSTKIKSRRKKGDKMRKKMRRIPLMIKMFAVQPRMKMNNLKILTKATKVILMTSKILLMPKKEKKIMIYLI